MRKRELGDSFEMVLDPFMFNMEMTALADVANALVDTGATKTCIGLDVVKEVYGIPNPKAEAVIIGMDVLGQGDLHIWKEGGTHFGTFSF